MSKVFMKFDKNIARWRFWKKVPNSVSCTQFLENETLLGIFKHCNNILFVGLLVIVGPQFLFSLRVLKNLKRRQNGTSIFLRSFFFNFCFLHYLLTLLFLSFQTQFTKSGVPHKKWQWNWLNPMMSNIST